MLSTNFHFPLLSDCRCNVTSQLPHTPVTTNKATIITMPSLPQWTVSAIHEPVAVSHPFLPYVAFVGCSVTAMRRVADRSVKCWYVAWWRRTNNFHLAQTDYVHSFNGLEQNQGERQSSRNKVLLFLLSLKGQTRSLARLLSGSRYLHPKSWDLSESNL